MSQQNYYLGEWLVEPALRRITKDGQMRKLEPQLMDVLQLLVRNREQVVSKEELNDTIWADVFITENVITRSISSLRKLLDDDPATPSYIETISKTGYRIIADVHEVVAPKVDNSVTIKLPLRPVFLVFAVIIFVVLGAFALRNAFLPSTSNNAFNPLAISNSATSEYWPAISPDGRFVAYGWKGKEDDNWDIYAKLIGTETVLRLTDHPATELRAKWSSNGNYVYYIRYENGGSTIYKKPLIGGNEIRVLDSPPFSFGDFDISPDEKWVSFNTRSDRNSPLRIVLISLETGEATILTDPSDGNNGDIHPRFSPDGSSLAYIREKNSVSMFLHIINLQSGNIEQVSVEPISINGFDWSQEGNSLIYASDVSGLYKLYEVNPDTKKSIPLKSGDYQMVMPRVAASGRIAYAKMRDNVNIWSYDRETQTANTWFATNELNLNAIPSPDGSLVCFTKPKNNRFEVWVSKPDGSEAIPITNFSGQYLTSPRWSMDSESIYFQGYMEGQSDLFKVDAKGGIPINLTNTSYDEHTPYLSPDKKVYFASNESGLWNIWSMDEDGDDRRKISNLEGYSPQLSLNGLTLYYLKKTQMGIWEYDLQSQTENLLIPDFHPMYSGALAVAENGIFYYHSKNKRFEFYDFETQQTALVYQPQRRIPRIGITLSFFPGNQLLLFSQIDQNDADIMLLEEQVN